MAAAWPGVRYCYPSRSQCALGCRSRRFASLVTVTPREFGTRNPPTRRVSDRPPAIDGGAPSVTGRRPLNGLQPGGAAIRVSGTSSATSRRCEFVTLRNHDHSPRTPPPKPPRPFGPTPRPRSDAHQGNSPARNNSPGGDRGHPTQPPTPPTRPQDKETTNTATDNQTKATQQQTQNARPQPQRRASGCKAKRAQGCASKAKH